METISAFVRIATHPRVFERPMTAELASRQVDDWLAVPTVWVPTVGANTVRHFTALVRDSGATVDADFARFDGVRWTNPLA